MDKLIIRPHLTSRVFNLTVNLIYTALPITAERKKAIQCDSQQFYLKVTHVAQFLAQPEQNYIFIEKSNPEVTDASIQAWLYGTIYAYMLQYHGYLVLHGSSILMNNRAVIISGKSGAGKSTLASVLVQNGYSFITDDLVVIKRNDEGQYCIIPGPTKLKLWHDSMQFFKYNTEDATLISKNKEKYAIPVTDSCSYPLIPISAFYELNINQQANKHYCEQLHGARALKTLMQNAYRYFMLEPLGKLQNFFQGCSGLSQQVSVNKLTRTDNFYDIFSMIEHIKCQQGISI
ncbi:MAG: hypothetical protein A3F18_03660 [Legionellales bacterium RIFCSPHIGHO2_12_FULL_37_14]|nr:MAG: hypothetical protein A3F18_03660 [Legionellales bacterium RIFCSPHIGHO2_12_FULL_37_14]